MNKYLRISYVYSVEKLSPVTKLNIVAPDEELLFTDIANEVRYIKLHYPLFPTSLLNQSDFIMLYTFEDGSHITKDNIPEGKFKVKRIIQPNDWSFYMEVTKSEKIKEHNGKINESLLGNYIICTKKNGNPNLNNCKVIKLENFSLIMSFPNSRMFFLWSQDI